MGRAGRGNSSGGSRSGGSRSSSRSGGGHRPSSSSNFSSSRPGRGTSGFGYGSPRPPRPSRPPRPPRYSSYPRYGRDRTVYVNNGSNSTLSTILAYGIVLLVVIAALFPVFQGYIGGQASTIERHKLESGKGFYTDCITDELGWFDNETRTESRLKDFYNETGVQPIIVFKAYDSAVTTDDQKETWAENYYENNIDREDAFLYVYFCEPNESDVGYMCYVNGYETSSVMDTEAVSIFWNNIDRYWYTDLSTDDVIVRAFDDTADTIMRVSTTGKDIIKWVIIAVVVIGGGIVVINIMKKKRENDAAEAAETERILNTPLDKMETDADTLASQYNNENKNNTNM